MSHRAEFLNETKTDLARRVGLRCSRPECRAETSGPRTGTTKSINVGVAAHIRAASPGGPRFDPALTKSARRSFENGIWLCQTCAKLIDSDTRLYTPSKLLQWKEIAERAQHERLVCIAPDPVSPWPEIAAQLRDTQKKSITRLASWAAPDGPELRLSRADPGPRNILTDAPLSRNRLEELMGCSFSGLVEVDTSSATFALDQDGILAEIAEALACHLRGSGVRPRRFDALMAAREESRSILRTLKEGEFRSGGPVNLEARMRAGAVEAIRKDGAPHTTMSGKRDTLIDRLKTNDITAEGIGQFTAPPILAVLEDIARAAALRGNPICFHMSGNATYPRALVRQLTSMLNASGTLDRIKVVISGPADDAIIDAWPADAKHLRQTSDGGNRLHESAGIPAWLRRWIAPGADIGSLKRLAQRNGDTLTRSLMMLTAGFGFVSAEALSDIFGMDYATCQVASQDLHSCFGDKHRVPGSWKTIVLRRLQPNDLVGLLPLKGIIEPDEFLQDYPTDFSFSRLAARAAYTLLTSRSLQPLDLAICLVLRADVRFQRRLSETVSTIRHCFRSYDPAMRAALERRGDLLDELAAGRTSENLTAYLEEILEIRRADFTDDMISEVYYQRAFIDYAAGDFAGAEEKLTLALACADSHRAYSLLGLIEIGWARPGSASFNKAIEYLDKSVSLNDGYPFSHYNLGVACQLSYQFEDAANHYVDCLTIEPTFYEALFNLTNVLLRIYCFEDAAQVAAYGMKMHQLAESEIGSNLAIALIKAGYLPSGIELLRYLGSRHDTPFVHYNLAWAYKTRASFEEAKHHLAKIAPSSLVGEFGRLVEDLRLTIASGDHGGNGFDGCEFRRARDLGVRVGQYLEMVNTSGFRGNVPVEKLEMVERLVVEARRKRRSPPISHGPQAMRRTMDGSSVDVGGPGNKRSRRSKGSNARDARDAGPSEAGAREREAHKFDAPAKSSRKSSSGGFYVLPSYSGG